MTTPPFDIAYDRALVEVLARGRAVADARFTPARGTASFAVTVVVERGPLGTTIADTVSASHIPYATAMMATGPGAGAITRDGHTARIDLVRLRAVREDDPALDLLRGAGVQCVRRDDRFALVLTDNSDDPFQYAPSGDARRLRGLARDEWVVLEEAECAGARRITAREIAAMFAERARAQGIAGRETLDEVGETIVALAGTERARVFCLRGRDGALVAGTIGLVARATYFGLVGCGVDTGPLAKRSPARLVKIAALDRMRRDGVTVYDFGMGETAEKRLVCNHRAPVFDVFVPFTFAGQMVGNAMAASLELRRRAKEARLGDLPMRWRRGSRAPAPAPSA